MYLKSERGDRSLCKHLATYCFFREFAAVEMANISTISACENPKGSSANEQQAGRRRSSTSQSRAQHVTTVKVFIAVFLLYLFSYLPSFLILFGVVDNFVFVYTYFLNHVGNPICYYVINREFRKDVHNLFVCNS